MHNYLLHDEVWPLCCVSSLVVLQVREKHSGCSLCGLIFVLMDLWINLASLICAVQHPAERFMQMCQNVKILQAEEECPWADPKGAEWCPVTTYTSKAQPLWCSYSSLIPENQAGNCLPCPAIYKELVIMHFKNEKFHVEAEDHPSKCDRSCTQVVLQRAHCADRNLFLFLEQPVPWFQTAKFMVVGQGQWFWKRWRNGGTSAKNSLLLSWHYNI